MDDERLHLDQWDRLTSAERAAVAREMAGRLPAPWRLLGLEWHALGDQRHEVAFFDWHGARFALIPGGEVTLGYDRAHPFVPNATQRASWEVELDQRAAWLEAGYLDHQLGSIEEFLDRILSPLRVVYISPLLLEVEATEGTYRLSSYQSQSDVTSSAPEYSSEWTGDYLGMGFFPFGIEAYAIDQDGHGVCYVGPPHIHHAVVAELARDNFRLPTSDEWEHACAAGARTLWRWGDDCPMTGWNYPSVGDLGGWDLHLQPNAFGLTIAADDALWEFCAEPGVMRGGDGGVAGCGGAAAFLVWMTLASAYIRQASADEVIYNTKIRRAYTIP